MSLLQSLLPWWYCVWSSKINRYCRLCLQFCLNSKQRRLFRCCRIHDKMLGIEIIVEEAYECNILAKFKKEKVDSYLIFPLRIFWCCYYCAASSSTASSCKGSSVSPKICSTSFRFCESLIQSSSFKFSLSELWSLFVLFISQ